MKALITVLPGDGIGPEVMQAGTQVLMAIGNKFGHQFELSEQLIGGAAIDATGQPLPDETKDQLQGCSAVLLGAVGGPKWSDPNASMRPEQGLLALRAELDVFANLRPVQIMDALADASPIKADRLKDVDILVVRELTGGIYFGDKHRDADSASDLCLYTRAEIERVIRTAATLAQSRRGRLCSVDKANVLESSRLWRDVTTNIVDSEFPDLDVEHMLVDAAAMHLINNPAQFDVIVTENMFGDILTDEASMLSGSLGMLPSASLGTSTCGLYEPIHGSAPDIAGKDAANPCGMIASVALMLRHSLLLDEEACAIETAIHDVIRDGTRTADIAVDASNAVPTSKMTELIVEKLR